MVSSEEVIALENGYGAHNYHPLPVVFTKGEGVFVWDPEGKKYYDFLSAYSAVNQGHCNERIVNAMIEQAKKLTLSSRAFFNDKLGEYSKFIVDFFQGYGHNQLECVLPMNTGAEGVETALKLARVWGYTKKNIPENEAIIVSCGDNFHGRTLAVISMSHDPDCREGFGPFMKGLDGHSVKYNDIENLKSVFESHGDKIAGFLIEPIQGEAGIIVPNDEYLKEAYALCKKHNILFIADEIQSGLARTGKMLAIDHAGVKPDVLILGKALSGGVFPVSAVLSSKEVMYCIKPGAHGSTYGGNPIACAVAMEALSVLKEDKLAERSEALGQRLRKGLEDLKCPFIDLIRGRGLLNAIVINNAKFDPAGKKKAWHLCLLLAEYGLLCKPTHDNIIRLAPPLVISEAQIDDCVAIVGKACKDIVNMKIEDIPRSEH